MTEIHNIVVATDFGEPSKQAIALGRSLAKTLGAHLTLVHVCAIPSPWRRRRMTEVPLVQIDAQKELDHEVLAIRMSGEDADGILETGEPSERIVAVAKEKHADLIVMGTHGRSGLSRLVMGSIADQVVRTSPIPVLTTTTA